jgi:hypothetical protein
MVSICGKFFLSYCRSSAMMSLGPDNLATRLKLNPKGYLNMRVMTFARRLTPLLLGASLLNAQASRTWVSGVGDDANPCSRTAPCKTFAGAISKTAAGGEIDALDPGGFGALTITKAITIDGGGGQVASVLVAGTNGIVVSAGINDAVVLRNLSINGIQGTGSGGLNGIRFLGGKSLSIENCHIFGFTQRGIDISPNNAGGNPPVVSIINTTSGENGDSGIRSSVTQRVLVAMINSRFNNNGSYGVFAGDYSRFSVSGSDASGNGTVGYIAQANAGDVVMNISNSTAINNSVATNPGGAGVQAGGGTNVSVVRLSGVVITSNFPNGIVTASNGSIVSFGNNSNSGNGMPNSTLPLQ